MQLSDTFLDELVKRLTEEKADVFGGFYAPFLRDCARDIAADESSAADMAGVAESALRSVMDSYVETGVRTLIASYHAQGGTYEAFHARVATEHGRGEILHRFPELERLLRIVGARTTRTVREVLRAAAQDQLQLADLLGAGGRITSVTPGLGDAHRGGRTVCLVTWSNGARGVYKPQQNNARELLRALQELLDADGSFFGPLHPRSVVRPNHLWQEFIEHTDLDDTAHAAPYFRRFGRVAALMTMIGATDLHHENIIATPEGPVVIDTETLVSLPSGPQTDSTGRSSLSRDIELSVLNTMLLPTRYTGAKLDIDISGIGCTHPGESQHLQSYTVVDAGTDAIRFDRIPVVVAHGSNMATASGEPLDPRVWTDDIVAGFSEARELLAAHKAGIEKVLRDSRDWSVRQVVRPTYVYARFLQASTHPVHLESPRARADLLGKLPCRYRGAAEESADLVHQEEVAALLDLDVPFFTVGCDSALLRGDSKEEIHSAAGVTPRQSALACVDAFFSRPPARDLAYLRYALASSVDDVWDVRGTTAGAGAERRVAFPDLTDPRAWHATLRDLVVGEESAPSWLMPSLQGPGLRLGGVNATLFDGGGLLVYLAQVEALTGTSLIGTDLLLASRTAALPQFAGGAAGTPLAMSPFTGSLSEAVTQWEVQRRRSPDNTDESWRLPFPAGRTHPDGPPMDVDRLTAEDFDYLNGYGGYLVYLARYRQHGAPELTGVAPELLLRRLVTIDGAPDACLGELGLAHGRFGRIAAMSALVAEGIDSNGLAREHLERFSDAYLRHRWQDDSLRDPASRTSWCKGYTGLAFAAGQLFTALGRPTDWIRTAITPEVEQVIGGAPGAPVLGGDLSFCHGLAGRIAVLCRLADQLDWPELRSAATTLRTDFIERYAAGGWSCGIGTEPHLPSFFLGLSGWHYAQLLLDHPHVELPLCLGGH